MQATENRKVLEPSLAEGLQRIAEVAAKVYGGDYLLVYKNEIGKSATSTSFVETLKKGIYEDEKAEDVRSILAEMEWPEDGSKTAILLAAAFVDSNEALSEIDESIIFAIKKVEEMAREGQGKLPGGGLWLLTLVRPLIRFSEEKHCEAARLLAQAAIVPMKVLAENNGKAFHEVYERVRAVSPNQFYSLHQIGLKNSHIPIHENHMDVIQFGLDITTGKIANLMEREVIVEEETAKRILEQTKAIILTLGRVRSVWL